MTFLKLVSLIVEKIGSKSGEWSSDISKLFPSHKQFAGGGSLKMGLFSPNNLTRYGNLEAGLWY